MKQYRVEHPDGERYAIIGFDQEHGWYSELRDGLGRLGDEYDALAIGRTSSVQGVLRFLMQHGFFEDAHVHDAMELLPHIDDPDEIDDPDLRRAAEVIVALKQIGAT